MSLTLTFLEEDAFKQRDSRFFIPHIIPHINPHIISHKHTLVLTEAQLFLRPFFKAASRFPTLGTKHSQPGNKMFPHWE